MWGERDAGYSERMVDLEHLAHPALRSVAKRLEQVASEPGTGLLKKHPELAMALDAQLPGLVIRDQMLAHNVLWGTRRYVV